MRLVREPHPNQSRNPARRRGEAPLHSQVDHMTDYLYVKNWHEFQHYKKRNPPWIKLHRRLLKDGDFHRLTEAEQWQLVRIWLVAADEHPGGWVPNDASWLRRMTGSDKPIALKKLVAGGWLEERDASARASALASNGASSTDSSDTQNYPPMLPPRGSEVHKELPSFLPTVARDAGTQADAGKVGRNENRNEDLETIAESVLRAMP